MRTAFCFLSVACLAALSTLPAIAADGPDAQTAADRSYTQALEKRAADILDVLGLDDPAKAARVRETVINQYRGLRKLQDTRDGAIKALKDQPGLAKQLEEVHAHYEATASALNDSFLAALSSDLSPAQVEKVKDKMTYNKLKVTYDGYLEMLPDLTPAQKAAVFEMLKEARDKATYAGSAEEKTEIFNRYKGRANNYLSAGLRPETRLETVGRASKTGEVSARAAPRLRRAPPCSTGRTWPLRPRRSTLPGSCTRPRCRPGTSTSPSS